MIKFLNAIFKRPAAAIMIIAAIAITGIISAFNIRMEYFPDMEMPMEVVYIMYPGADADTVERLVTEPVEELGSALTDLDSIVSHSYENYATIQFSYEYGTDLDEAYMELKEELDKVQGSLPAGCGTPVIMEVSLDNEATMSIGVKSVDGSDILDYVNRTVVKELEKISGIAQVEVIGSQDTYARIVLDEERMKQYGLTLQDISTSISDADFQFPLGDINLGTQSIGVSATTNFNWHDLSDLALQTRNGATVHLGDISSFMNLSRSEPESISRFNGQDSIRIDLTKKSSAPTIATCRQAEAVLESIAQEGVEFQIISSSAENIMDSLVEVLQTLAIGVLFTMVVLFLFFGDIRASLIVGSSMPLSLLGALAILTLLGIPFDLMTGTGMIIAIGMIVDNSIVVLESCFRERETEPDIKKAAAAGTKNMLLSVFASTITTVVVYGPISISSGMSGQMNRPLCYTVIFTMLASLLSSITVVPLLFTLVKPVEKKDLPVTRILQKLAYYYQKIMKRLLHHQVKAIVSAVGILLFSLILALQLNIDIFPSSYDGSIRISTSFRPGTKLEVMDEKIKTLEQVLLADTNFEDVQLKISDNTAVIDALSSKNCDRSSEASVEYYTDYFSDMTDVDVMIEPTGVVTGLASLMSTGNNVEITLVGDDLEMLRAGAAMTEEALIQVPGVMHVSNDFSQEIASCRLVIDQQKAAHVGMTPSGIAMQVYNILNGATVTTVHYEDEDYDIKLEYPEGKYEDITSVLDSSVSTGTGSGISLRDLAQVEYVNVPQTIVRQDEQFETTITATTASKGKYDISADIQNAVGQIDFPDGVEKAQSSVDKQLMKEAGILGGAMAIAVLLVFLVMSIQFASAKLSLMVMCCIPFSLIGSFGLLFLSKTPLSMMAMMGFLMLTGMVVNNGILLVDATNELRKKLPLKEALIEAGLIRIRPILMTTLTTVLSMLPMILSGGSGMTMMRGMGFVIIGGLCASTILAMFFMPILYLVMNKRKGEEDER